MNNAHTESVTQWSARAVDRAIKVSGHTKRWVSEETGIPYSTLNRKLDGKADFTFKELLGLSEAIGVSPASFIPPLFRSPVELAVAA